MTRKRFKKLLMGMGVPRNGADLLAREAIADGLSYRLAWLNSLIAFLDAFARKGA